MIEEKWKAEGWRMTPSGNWYHANVCRGMAAHLPALCDECGAQYLCRKHRTQRRERSTGKRFCSTSCRSRYVVRQQDISHLAQFEFHAGEHPHNFNGYRSTHGAGYILVGKERQLEHRAVMRQHLGRVLESWEIVHHLNGDRTDNRLENLQVMTQSEHMKEHWAAGSFASR